MRIRFHGLTDPGRRRPTNEDAFVVSDEGSFCVLCDGMGGHASGEVASRMAVEILSDRLRAAPGGDCVEGKLKPLLDEWLKAANGAIYARGTADATVTLGRNMGTTLALLWLRCERAVIAHIGDSRVYRLREGRIEPLTRDHSVTAPEPGFFTAIAGRPMRKRKYVTRALGTRPEVAADLVFVEVRAGDRFVICSDGLTDLVRDEEIAMVLEDTGVAIADAPKMLVDLANERGGRDNITVVIGEVEADPEPPAAPAPLDAREPAGDVTPRMGVGRVPGEDTLSDFPEPPPFEPPPPWDSGERDGAR